MTDRIIIIFLMLYKLRLETQIKKTFDPWLSRTAANMMLLLVELADEREQAQLGPFPEIQLQLLMAEWFHNPKAYQFLGGPKR